MLTKIYRILFVLLTLFESSYSQVPDFKWANNIKDFSTLWNGPTDIKTDASGNVYVVGRFAGLKDFDLGPSVYNLATPGPGGNSDIFILKLDSLGNFLWVKQVGGSASEFCGNLTLDAAGNIYLAGQFKQTVDFDPGPGTYILSSTNFNVFVLKLDVNGNFVYAKQLPGNWPSIAIALDANNNVLVTGSFSGLGDFDPGIGIFNLLAGGNGDVFILKLDFNGNFIWAKSFGGNSAEEGVQIKCDAMSNVFVAGHFDGTSFFGSTTNIFTSFGEKDIFFLKLDSLGNFQWVKRIGGTGYDRIRSMDIDATNNMIATGLFSDSCDMDPGPAIITFSTSTVNTFILKLDNAGNHIWSKQLGDSVGNAPYDIYLDQWGNVYTIGYYQGVGDFDPGPSVHILSSPSNAYNTFISKLDNAGNNLWVGNLGDSASTQGIAMTVSNNENVYITGFFFGIADFNPGIQLDTLSSEGQDENMFVAGYGKCMQPIAPTMSNPLSNLKVCIGGTTSLAVAGTGTVNWYPSQYGNVSIGTGNNFITSQLTVNTTFYVDDNTTCAQSIGRTALNVTINQLPTINVSSSHSIVCVGESVTLTAIGANSYTWEPNSNSSIFVVTPSILDPLAYEYSVIGTDINGCVNEGTALFYTELCVGMDRFETIHSEIKIYPTPSQGILKIETADSDSSKISEVNITNALGQIVIQEKIIFDRATATIDASDLPTGVYYLSFSSGESKKSNMKIIIIH